jgi:hypothetical protein
MLNLEVIKTTLEQAIENYQCNVYEPCETEKAHYSNMVKELENVNYLMYISEDKKYIIDKVAEVNLLKPDFINCLHNDIKFELENKRKLLKQVNSITLSIDENEDYILVAEGKVFYVLIYDTEIIIHNVWNSKEEHYLMGYAIDNGISDLIIMCDWINANKKDLPMY